MGSALFFEGYLADEFFDDTADSEPPKRTETNTKYVREYLVVGIEQNMHVGHSAFEDFFKRRLTTIPNCSR